MRTFGRRCRGYLYAPPLDSERAGGVRIQALANQAFARPKQDAWQKALNFVHDPLYDVNNRGAMATAFDVALNYLRTVFRNQDADALAVIFLADNAAPDIVQLRANLQSVGSLVLRSFRFGMATGIEMTLASCSVRSNPSPPHWKAKTCFPPTRGSTSPSQMPSDTTSDTSETMIPQ